MRAASTRPEIGGQVRKKFFLTYISRIYEAHVTLGGLAQIASVPTSRYSALISLLLVWKDVACYFWMIGT